ncbi:hypothetical protein [Oribacterium sp. FC2011]|uniref:hypothetical protein n=1 Tax=Oribacterium sp. FC2011 TaxID=1408311 RepID=UPI0004E1F777|nr:hypothetical protein [Oribacterium sp. FC2011]
MNKVKIAGTAAVLSALLLMGCAKKTKAPADDPLQDPKPGTIAWGMKYGSSDRITTPSVTSRIDETSTGDTVSDNKEVVILGTGASTEHWDEATDPIAQKSLALLLPADDEYDFKWANDHESSEIIKFIYARDAKANEEIFGYPKPTEQELYAVLESNNNISSKYKEFIRDFIHKFLTLYPETDFSVFKHNLETLVVDELTEREIQMKAMSFGTVACYLNNENTICVRQDNEAMDTTTNDYVVLTHELMHACRICRSKDINGKQVNVKFYDDSDMGLYEDEALITQFAYEMQGLGNKSIYYTFQTNIYRQMLDGMDYDGADYMNHSVNYFIEKLQEKFDKTGVEIPAYHFVNLVDAYATIHYKDYDEPAYNSFEDMFKAITVNYTTTHLTPDMTYEETEKEWNAFWDDIYFHVAELSTPYPELNQECFRPYWDEQVQKLGISQQ